MPLQKPISALGGMVKPIYDIDEDGHVNTAEALNDGAGATAAIADINSNTTHRSSDGTDHANVVTNDTHVAGDGSDHADVATNTTHGTGDGSDHTDVATNTTHISSDGKDHSDVVTNNAKISYTDAAAVALNTTHRSSDGKNHSDVIANNAKVGVTTEISNVLEDTTPQLGGDLDNNEKNISLTPIPGSDLTANGDIATMTVDANATGIGAALYMAADGNFEETDADAAATMPCRALALETGTGSKKVLLRGFIRKDAWTWTPGGNIYVDTTTGALTQTAPSGSGDQVQAVGFATHADRMFFNPSLDMVEIL